MTDTRLKIAVCDDSEVYSGYIASAVMLWARERQRQVQINAFSSAEEFLFRYEEDKDTQILLLDIEMGKMNGVELAKAIRQENKDMQIVFITGYSEYISEGYDVAALHYLMKPINRDKLFEVLDRALEKMKENERYLNLEHSGESVRIAFRDIRYLEVRQNYVTVQAKGAYTVKKPLREIEETLDGRFFRIGRSYIVNLLYIQRITKTDVYLFDGTALPLPRGMHESLNRAVIDLEFRVKS
ncbi:MAG: response regulator transcription factor [Oscillospiraceae bacterium]|nr:response regulator transcription factor [Oscillospiraceae bacterium]